MDEDLSNLLNEGSSIPTNNRRTRGIQFNDNNKDPFSLTGGFSRRRPQIESNEKKGPKNEEIPEFLKGEETLDNKKEEQVDNIISGLGGRRNRGRSTSPVTRKEEKQREETPVEIHDNFDDEEQPKKNLITNKNVFSIGSVAAVGAIAAQTSESAKQTINQLNEELKIERDKHNNDIHLYESKLKQKDKDYNDKIDELKQKHKNDLEQYENTFKIKEDSLKNEIERLKKEIEEGVINERNKNKMLHQAELETVERNWQNKLDSQKKELERQNEILNKQLQQQIEVNKLANKVENSSNQINELMEKISKEKSDQNESNRLYRESLVAFEERLKRMEEDLKEDKSLFTKSKMDYEKEISEKKKANADETARIKKEIARLEQMQDKFKLEQYESKEKFEREKIDLVSKHDEMKLELETLKANYQSKLNEVEYQKKILEEEKKYFDKFKEESLKNIEIKKMDLQNLQAKYYAEETEIKGRIKVLQEKEFYLNDKFDEFEKTKQTIIEEKQKIEKGNKDLIIAARRLDESIRAVDEKNNRLEKEKEELMKQYNDIETEKMNINNEKLKIAQEKSDIRLRLQSIDMMRMKYVSEPLSFLPTPTPSNQNFSKTFQTINPKTFTNSGKSFYSSTQKTGFYDTQNFNQTAKGKSFNADKYFSSLKNKINSQKIMEESNYSKDLSPSGGNFNEMIMKEKEFIKKSMESMDNNTKNEYEKMKKNYLNNLSSSSNIMLHKEEDVKIDSVNYNKSGIIQPKQQSQIPIQEIDNFEEIEK